MIKRSFLIMVVCGLLAMTGCGYVAAPGRTVGLIDITGTIAYKEFEGGFYAIDGDNGGKYNPLNLTDDFRKNGLRVRMTAVPQPDMTSMHNYGEIIEVKSISSVD